MLQQVQCWLESGSSLLPFPPVGKKCLAAVPGVGGGVTTEMEKASVLLEEVATLP